MKRTKNKQNREESRKMCNAPIRRVAHLTKFENFLKNVCVGICVCVQQGNLTPWRGEIFTTPWQRKSINYGFCSPNSKTNFHQLGEQVI